MRAKRFKEHYLEILGEQKESKSLRAATKICKKKNTEFSFSPTDCKMAAKLVELTSKKDFQFLFYYRQTLDVLCMFILLIM